MQPRLRTLVWKEMPPCVRRLAIGWSRRLLYAELFLGRLYASWTKSPTWNFVAVAGTLGIVLTILLFLTPWDAEADANVGTTRTAVRKSRPAWELDSRLMAIRAEQEPPYPIEVMLARESRSVGTSSSVTADSRPRRRVRDAAEDQPLLPLFEPEPAVAVRPRQRIRREPDPDFDWSVSEAPEPPQLSLESEVVLPTRRRRHDPVETEMTWTGRTQPANLSFNQRRSRFDIDDPWQPYDVARVAHEDTFGSGPFGNSLTVPAAHADRPLGTPWEPLPIPAAAPRSADVQLEISWDRTATRRREPQLHVRNTGADRIERIDILPGQLPQVDLSAPATFLTQAITELSPGNDESVSLPLGGSRRRSAGNLVSVLLTAFVGGTTRVDPAVAERREPVRTRAKPPAREREPERRREPERPHLSMTTGKPGRLPLDNMVSVPIRVTNDGNVPLSDIVILAKIPATLEHEHGRNVHYRLGQLQPGEQRTATLLLTPLEAGSATVPLEATDGKLLAFAEVEADIHVVAEELKERNDSRRAARRSADRTSRRK